MVMWTLTLRLVCSIWVLILEPSWHSCTKMCGHEQTKFVGVDQLEIQKSNYRFHYEFAKLIVSLQKFGVWVFTSNTCLTGLGTLNKCVVHLHFEKSWAMLCRVFAPYEVPPRIPEYCPFRLQTKQFHVIFHTFSPSIPAPEIFVLQE